MLYSIIFTYLNQNNSILRIAIFVYEHNKEMIMGFFDKIKEKVSNVVKSTAEAVSFDKLKEGLSKTRDSFVKKIHKAIGSNRKIDDRLIEEIEEILISADIGVYSTDLLINSLKAKVKKEGYENPEDIIEILKDEIYKILSESNSKLPPNPYEINIVSKPLTILIVGVNGVGKTTTIGKLAYNYTKAGKKVLIGAADTFRAAANEQLEIWAQRAGVNIIQQKQGADPAAVAYDTLNSAISKDYDVVLIDTAGRLHNKIHLMSELQKIGKVMKKLKASAPDEVFLVLDATTGQNAIIQAREFSKVADLTGIILTKLDGTAKGGVIIPIINELKIPVRFIGVGEKIDDLQAFDPEKFIVALFEVNGKN